MLYFCYVIFTKSNGGFIYSLESMTTNADHFSLHSFTLECAVLAEVSVVWNYLTNSDLVNQWMSDDKNLSISTDWIEGHPIKIKGTLSGKPFVNDGTITGLVQEKTLRYEYVNSISLEHYKIAKQDVIEFTLSVHDNGTKLNLNCETNYTEVEEKHLRLYWGATLNVLKEMVENGIR